MNLFRFGVGFFLALGACATTSVQRDPAHQACVEGDLGACVRWGDTQLNQGSAGKRGALTAFTFACSANHAPACTKLAELYGERQDDPRQIREALKKACEGGEHDACVTFASKMPRRRAIPYFTAACDANVAQGCVELAAAYREVWKLDDFLMRSVSLDEKACELGNKRGCVGAGQAYLFGSGVAQDTAHGLKLLESTCDETHPDGCAVLARIYEDGVGVPPNVRQSNVYYELAAKHTQVAQVDSAASAFVVYIDGCNRGDTLGCFNAAAMLAEGIDVDRNVATAHDLYEKACMDGCPLACERQKKIRIRHSGKDGL